MKAFVGILLVLLFVLSGAGSAGATLLTNGDFSDGWNGWLLHQNVTINPGAPYHPDYVQFNNSGVGQVGKLIQKFYIPTGATGINVSFDYRANFGVSNADGLDAYFKSLVNLEHNGTGWFDFTKVILNTNDNTGWTSVNMMIDFVSPVFDVDPNARIRFEWNEKDDWMSMAKLDNVKVDVAPVPEPSTILLLGSGLLGVVFLRRKIEK